MGAGPGKRLWNQTARLVPTITVAICFGELIIVLALAIALLAASTFKFSIAVLPFLLRPRGMDVGRLYHASPFVTCYRPSPARDSRPQDAIDKIFWQIRLAFGVVYLTTGGTVLAGALVAYDWYLSVHYCADHNQAILRAPLLKHHLYHHKFARRNYGVATKV